MNLLFKDESYKIIKACYEVHNELGCGFLEPVYQEALEQEFILQNIPFEREKELPVHYKNIKLNKYYKADFICYDKIILELKALSEFTKQHESQVLNYLKASKLQLGILINFGVPSLQQKRLVRNRHN